MAVFSDVLRTRPAVRQNDSPSRVTAAWQEISPNTPPSARGVTNEHALQEARGEQEVRMIGDADSAATDGLPETCPTHRSRLMRLPSGFEDGERDRSGR